MSEKKVYLLMILTAGFWSGAFITGKLAIIEFPVFSLVFFRFLIALPFIFAILIKMRPKEALPAKNQWLPLIVLGIIGTFSYHVLFFLSLNYTGAVNASLIAATLPTVTAVLAGIFGQEKIKLLQAAGIVLAFGGIFLVVTDGNLSLIKNFQFNLGDILMFAAVCCMSVYTILSRVFLSKYQIPPVIATAYTFLACVIFSLPFVLNETSLDYLASISLGGWLSAAYMAIFSSVLGYLFQFVAIQEIGAPKTATFTNLVPVFTIILAVAFLGENVGVPKLLSAAITILGVYLAVRPDYLKSNSVSKTPV